MGVSCLNNPSNAAEHHMAASNTRHDEMSYIHNKTYDLSLIPNPDLFLMEYRHDCRKIEMTYYVDICRPPNCRFKQIRYG